ncbi:MAG: AAA family ATPase, partial [Caldilineaceae bacterium]|nr:AAA family ATPase [Caldilineaceae bacterium]
MDELAADHGLTLAAGDYKGKFRELIERLADNAKIVLLVDEYDKPITDLLEQEQRVAEHVDTLKNFYSVLKSAEAAQIHFALFTGVSKYGKISIFSDLNNLIDITLDGRFATLLGYTEQELVDNFGDYIDRLCRTFQSSRAEMMEQIRFWYNGYSWNGEQRLYVPFSTMIFLTQQSFANHWFATATPSFLVKLLKQHQIPAYALEDLTADSQMLDSADVNNLSVLSMLFQTGYLTVKQMHRSFRGDQYMLGYPNHEVAQSFQQHLLTSYLDANLDRVSTILLGNLERTLHDRDLAGFMTVLQSIFATIPHHLFLPQEAYYHSVVYLVLKLLGFAVYAERFTNLGRIDAVLEMQEVVYIIEFKMSTADTALDQIRDKGYAQPYLGCGKSIILLGIAFDKASRNIVDWKAETVE